MTAFLVRLPVRVRVALAFTAAMAVLLAAAPLTSGSGRPSPAPLWPSTVPALAVPASTGPPASPAPAGTGQAGQGPAWQQIILPDLAVIEPHGLSVADMRKLGKVRGARDALAVDGAAIEVRGRRVNVIGVDPQRFRSWTPLATASDQRLWEAIAGGDFVSAGSARHRLRLHSGTRYQLAGASRVTLAYGGAATFGIAGVDLVVSTRASAALGLIHNVAALISAPGVAMPALKREVRAALGGAGRVVSLREPELPVDTSTHGGKPATYLQLFRESAARYCPGLSWTVLAAIGQIESGDGANNGPSTAGAEGPMQFLPSTWQEWGITAFGESGPPNVMDPYDAVPSAARYLCAAGAGTPAGLPRAILAYNHATWYVTQVLALAHQYARVYG
ncbi:MAG TPA: lytic transglycosylase domain-containing protein [Streptosporangiaceae bacterium]|nr:lytic transglycosylase domain-containing protein [Streptosporangiaceae bacterium]